VNASPNGSKYYIIPNPKLLAEKLAQFSKADTDNPGKKE
jgi:hypothetical protein